MKRYLILVLLLCGWSHAQFVTISGTVLDPSGVPYQNGSGKAVLVPQNQQWLINNTNPVNSPVIINGLDSFGRFSIQLTNTAIIAPQSANPQWQFSFCSQALSGQQPVCFTMTPLSLTSSQDISVAIQAQSAPLPNIGTGITLQTNGNPNGSQTVLNLQQSGNTTITDNGHGTVTISSSGGGGGGGITGTLTQNKVPKALTTGTNPAVVDSSITDTGSNVTTPVFENTANSTDFIWSQSPAGTLTASLAATVTLSPCPLGIDTTNGVNRPYVIRIDTVGTPEQVQVTGGTCTSGSASGTVIFTPANSHSAGWTIGTATAGIQEALNTFPGPNSHLIIPPVLGGNGSPYPIYTKVIVNSNRTTIDGSGALVKCFTRDSCFFIGNLTDDQAGAGVTVRGLRFAAGTDVDGVKPTQVSVTSNVMTVTAAGHPFIVGDRLSIIINVPGQTVIRNLVNVSAITTNTFSFPVSPRADFAISSAFGNVAIMDSMVEDNGIGTNFTDIKVSSVGGGHFNNYMVFSEDQAALMHHFLVDGPSALRVTANWVGWVVWNNGTAVLTIDGESDLSAGCGNGIHNLGGNGVTIRDTVIQAYSQHGFWQGRSGLQGSTLDNVYFEVGACLNPLYPGTIIAANGATVLNQSLKVSSGFHASGPIGQMPSFSNTGGNRRNYYIVPRSSASGGPAMPLFAGTADSDNVTPIAVYWPQIVGATAAVAGTITYDVLVTTGTAAAPNGTGNYSIATNNSGSCSAGICTFTDTFGSPASYAVGTPVWYPAVYEWPSGVMVSNYDDINNPLDPAAPLYMTDYLQDQTASPMLTSLGHVSFIADVCAVGEGTSQGVAFLSCQSIAARQGATVLTSGRGWPATSGAGGNANLKGRLIFENRDATPTHYVTFNDCNPNKTIATSGNRPTNDACDLWAGTDDASGSGSQLDLAFGSSRNLSFYINNIGDGTNYLERLSASLKTFKVPITTNSQVTSTLVTGTAPLVIASSTPVANLTASNHALSSACIATANNGTCTAFTAVTASKIIYGDVLLAAGTSTLGGLPFTGATTYRCGASDVTNANAIKIAYDSGAQITVTGTGTDVISVVCVGN